MPKLYGSVNGQSKRIKKLYGSVNGQSKEISKLYGSVNGVSKLIYQKTLQYGIVYYLEGGDTKSVELQSVSEFNSLNGSGTSWSTTVGVDGITVGSDNIVGVEIGDSITTIPAGFLRYCTLLNMPLTVPDNVTSIGASFLYGCFSFNQPLTLSNNISKIQNSFLYGCSAFNQPLTIPDNVTQIDSSFLHDCISFNQTLSLSNSLIYISSYFMYQCIAFNQDLFLPSSLANYTGANGIAGNFMYRCNSMTSTINVGALPGAVIISNTSVLSTNSAAVAAYTRGIKIAGANRSEWLSRLPNRTGLPYRKLIDAGY